MCLSANCECPLHQRLYTAQSPARYYRLITGKDNSSLSTLNIGSLQLSNFLFDFKICKVSTSKLFLVFVQCYMSKNTCMICLYACYSVVCSRPLIGWIPTSGRKSGTLLIQDIVTSNVRNLLMFGEHFWKKVFFHPRVPPLVFGLSVRSFFGRGRGKIWK